ncbi:MAG: hypothetical protein ACFFBD_06970 [Candidatus Hodarchaeota archaeon]
MDSSSYLLLKKRSVVVMLVSLVLSLIQYVIILRWLNLTIAPIFGLLISSIILLIAANLVFYYNQTRKTLLQEFPIFMVFCVISVVLNWISEVFINFNPMVTASNFPSYFLNLIIVLGLVGISGGIWYAARPPLAQEPASYPVSQADRGKRIQRVLETYKQIPLERLGLLMGFTRTTDLENWLLNSNLEGYIIDNGLFEVTGIPGDFIDQEMSDEFPVLPSLSLEKHSLSKDHSSGDQILPIEPPPTTQIMGEVMDEVGIPSRLIESELPVSPKTSSPMDSLEEEVDRQTGLALLRKQMLEALKKNREANDDLQSLDSSSQ